MPLPPEFPGDKETDTPRREVPGEVPDGTDVETETDETEAETEESAETG